MSPARTAAARTTLPRTAAALLAAGALVAGVAPLSAAVAAPAHHPAAVAARAHQPAARPAGAAPRAVPASGPVSVTRLRAVIPAPTGYRAGAPSPNSGPTRFLQPCVVRNGGEIGRSGFFRNAIWYGPLDIPRPSVTYSIVQFASASAARAAWNARLPGMTTGCAGTRTANLDAIGGRVTVTVSSLPRKYGFRGVRQDATWRVAYAEGYTPGPREADLVLQRLVGPGWLTVEVRDATRSTLTSAVVARALAAMDTLATRYAAAVGP